MIFSPRVLTNKWEVLKPFLIFFQNMELEVFWNINGFVIDNAWCNELIAYSCA
jgi:hypothetical protein